jgi:hypothetical protein
MHFTKDDRWCFRRAEKDILINANARAFVFCKQECPSARDRRDHHGVPWEDR